MTRFFTDSMAALEGLTTIERSFAALELAVGLAAIVCLRELTRRVAATGEPAELDEAA